MIPVLKLSVAGVILLWEFLLTEWELRRKEMKWWQLLWLGVDIAQYAELSRTRSDVRSIKEEQLSQALHQHIIEGLRKVAFASSQAIKALEKQAKRKPILSYVGARLLEYRHVVFRITPEFFSEFVDMEYIGGIQASIERTKETASQLLSDGETEKAEQAVRTIIEMPLLNAARESKITAARIEETDDEWKPLSSRRVLLLVAAVGIMLAMPVALFVMPWLLGGAVNAVGGSDIAGVGFLLGCLLPFGMPLLSIVLLIVASPARYKELRQIRDAEFKKLAASREREGADGAYDHLSIEEIDSLIARNKKTIEKTMGDSGETMDYEFLLLG